MSRQQEIEQEISAAFVEMMTEAASSDEYDLRQKLCLIKAAPIFASVLCAEVFSRPFSELLKTIGPSL